MFNRLFIMSNYVEFDNRITFHPGYYIKELVEDSGLSLEDYAKKLGTSTNCLSALISGKKSLSGSIAEELSFLTGTSVSYWLNIQQTYDETLKLLRSHKE